MADEVVWIFNGGGTFPSGAFTSRDKAEEWIQRHGLTGTLTSYPLDIGVYDWVLQQGWFQPKRDYQKTPKFIGEFSSASQPHHHYENGRNDSLE